MPMTPRNRIATRLVWLGVAVLAALPGCATTSRRSIVPADSVGSVTHVQTSAGAIPVRERYYPGQGVVREAIVPDGVVAPGPPPPRPDGTVGYDLLALSGGGSNGAFGAGLLCGWTLNGDRPDFQIVTGISTGSLLSSFAFAGPSFDARLHEAFTTIAKPQVYRRIPLIALPWSESLGRTDPLDHLISHYADADLLRAVALQHRLGRRLYVGTSHLDHKRLVMWDMGSIAACNHPGAPELYRRVLRASSSIPVLFSPVEFEVVANDRDHTEMHVDGGARAQVFMRRVLVTDLLPAPVATRAGPEIRPARFQGPSEQGPALDLSGSRLYVVVNGKLRPDAKAVRRRLAPIAAESLESLMSASFNGDLYRMFLLTSSTGMDFRMQAIPQDAAGVPGSAQFDREAMGRVFLIGYNMARARTPWMPAPRGLDDQELHMLESGRDAAVPLVPTGPSRAQAAGPVVPPRRDGFILTPLDSPRPGFDP